MAEEDYDTINISTASLTAQVTGHILQKGWQAGGLLGPALILPVMAFRRKSLDVDLALRAAAYGGIGFTGLTGVLAVAKLSTVDRDGIADRAYRLHYNEGQNRMDLFAQVGAVLGLAAMAFVSKGGGPALHYVGAAALGSGAGVLAHIATVPQELKTANKMLHEATRKD